jgi:hypothetical protein
MDSHEQQHVNQLVEKARKAEVNIRRANAVLILLAIAFSGAFVFDAWSCRDDCSSFSWFYLFLYPAAVVFYFVRQRQRRRRDPMEQAK